MLLPPPLRLLVDLTRLQSAGTGGGIRPALLEMLRWLAGPARGELQFVYVVQPGAGVEARALAGPLDTIVEAAKIPRDLAAQHACDAVFCPFGITDCACPGIPTVTLVVDLLHRDFPASLPEPDRIYREQEFAAALIASDWFQVISDFTGERLQACYAVPPGRIFRTHLAVHSRLTPVPEAAADGRPFFFYPANFWAHKNHETLFVAYALYRHAAGGAAWPLVLTGHQDTGWHRLRVVLHALGLEAHVTYAGYVADDKLTDCYRTAGALVFPSLHEGFGIPLVEAMAFGTPIIASDATAIPEVTGSAALLVDARRPEDLAAGLLRLSADPALRRELVALGRTRLAGFSIATEFGRLREMLGRAAQGPARWRNCGYYAIDGLTDPVAIFALPAAREEITLTLALRPLPALRTVHLFCGVEPVAQRVVPANQPHQLVVRFMPGVRTITLRVPDAQSLSPTDPRTHGVLVESLRVQTSDGRWHDLLTANPA